jgi:predicted membrane channel-forming protein YqfA (hemolysin III family)
MGIVMLIEGSILPSLYYGFQHDRHLMMGYMGKHLLDHSYYELM